MIRKLTAESAIKLQRILSKRLGRLLSDKELQEAYNNLMEYAYALVDLASSVKKTIIYDVRIGKFVFECKSYVANAYA